MTVCSLCGKDDLGFNCPYCNNVYCSEHRLPESHGCAGLHLVREEARKKTASSLYSDADAASDIVPTRVRKPIRAPRTRPRRFSQTEVRDLSISLVLVALVAISVMGQVPIGVINGFILLAYFASVGLLWIPLAIVAVFLLSFIAHELAHKFAAQHYGMWSEFRMTPQGYYLSLLAILTAFPIFGTGAVMTGGAGDRDQYAKSTLAGPLTNLLIAVAMISLGLVLGLASGVPFGVLLILRYAAQLNSFIGLFNMIPFPPFDGGTVLRWNKSTWIVLVVSLLIAIVLSYMLLPLS
ncbi:MAG: hypothetical protein HXY34_09075 [Candidatus Thorarchaeota archaeon]|nr:hypothetical protein [Candidatus Thorarchaeota archaeon]